MANQIVIGNCTTMLPNLELCLPLPCADSYILQESDSCMTIEYTSPLNLTFGDVRAYNPWMSYDCENLQEASAFYGNILCLSPQNGGLQQDGAFCRRYHDPDAGHGILADCRTGAWKCDGGGGDDGQMW